MTNINESGAEEFCGLVSAPLVETAPQTLVLVIISMTSFAPFRRGTVEMTDARKGRGQAADRQPRAPESGGYRLRRVPLPLRSESETLRCARRPVPAPKALPCRLIAPDLKLVQRKTDRRNNDMLLVGAGTSKYLGGPAKRTRTPT